MLCKQTQPVQLTHLDKEYEAHPVESYFPFTNNCRNKPYNLDTARQKWSPMYSKHKPTDIKLLATGKLQLNCVCKAYIVYILSR